MHILYFEGYATMPMLIWAWANCDAARLSEAHNNKTYPFGNVKNV